MSKIYPNLMGALKELYKFYDWDDYKKIDKNILDFIGELFLTDGTARIANYRHNRYSGKAEIRTVTIR